MDQKVTTFPAAREITFMRHWNACPMCAIDIETTGLDPDTDEILEIAILPMNHLMEPFTKIPPFNIYIHPLATVNELQAKVKCSKTLINAINYGFPADKAEEILREWIAKLDLNCTDWGTPKRIIPVGHNYAFDRSFLVKWLGETQYNDLFHSSYRDTMIIASFINDYLARKACPVMFNKVGLSWCAEVMHVDHPIRHEALEDARITAEVYKRMVEKALTI